MSPSPEVFLLGVSGAIILPPYSLGIWHTAITIKFMYRYRKYHSSYVISFVISFVISQKFCKKANKKNTLSRGLNHFYPVLRIRNPKDPNYFDGIWMMQVFPDSSDPDPNLPGLFKE